MPWKLWCPTNRLPPETWDPGCTNYVSSDRSGCICCPTFCEKKKKREICDHQSHTEDSPYGPQGIECGLAACALCYSPVCASSTPFSGRPPKPHPSQRNRNMETAADHNFLCFIFKPPGQVFNFITVPLPTTVWWSTQFFSSIYQRRGASDLFKKARASVLCVQWDLKE